MKVDLNDFGAVQLLTDYVDAMRCFAIYDNPIAAERPAEAWLILPLGLDVKRSLYSLVQMPAETDPDPDLYRHNLGLLRYRRDAALEAWQAGTNTKQGVSQHVH